MERLLRPERLDVDPSATTASKLWIHWHRTFTNFVNSLPPTPVTDQSTPPTPQLDNRLNILINYVSSNVFEYISECTTYDQAITVLEELYNKPKNEIVARHLLATCKQELGQPLDLYVQKLKSLAKDCNFKQVSSQQNRDDAIRDAFITGLLDSGVRQRLLERESLDLQKAYDTARSLELAQRQSETYTTGSSPCGATATVEQSSDAGKPPNTNASSSINAIPSFSPTQSKCFFCGFGRHHRSKCPAKEAICKGCGKKGHFQKVCLSSSSKSAAINPLISVLASTTPDCLKQTIIKVQLNGITTKALIDTGSSESFIGEEIVKKRNLNILPSQNKIGMATNNLTSTTLGHVVGKLKYRDSEYEQIKLSVLPHLCTDIILGHDFLNNHEKLEIKFQGKRGPLSICSVAAAKVEEQSLFGNLQEGWKPIATKSRRYSDRDQGFISSEVSRLLQEEIIEPSKSPWRAQVLVTTNERQKKRMVVDYSQTVNKFTHLDAYPQKNISELIETISGYEIYSTLDLMSAYHQIPIKENEKIFTAFEANGNLYQFRRVPFGVTNGVACFQRIIDQIIENEKVEDTFAYVDNVTVCGKTQQEHDRNLSNFLEAARKHGITFNDSKSILSSPVIQLLGYEVKKGEIKPDPERLQPLTDLAPPKDMKSQLRIMGMFAYYAKWIVRFSEKSHPLAHNETFPLPETAMKSFLQLKEELKNAVLVTYDPNETLTVETDASEFAIAATLNQKDRPVAFFSRTLSSSEKGHSSIEKEAQAVVEALKKWKHYLLGRHFRLITDQRSVSFMFHNHHSGKVKNEKIQRWRLELSPFKYDIIYRPGKENVGADTFSRCAASPGNHTDLAQLHNDLCHPGVTRMNHFVKSRNLPFSIEDVKKTISQCQACAEMKPKFCTNQGKLIQATQPFERISLDFKGPIPSNTQNKYILTMIDEYSRFPFAFPCSNLSTKTVMNCLSQVFALFGMPAFIHSDRGASFMSEELKTFLHQKGVATSRTTPYNPKGNGQVERLNGTLWKTISLALRSNNMQTTQWETVLPQALHSIRSLLCTATNTTPHERLFAFNRRSTSGTTLPAWLTTPGPVLMRKNVRQSKYDPLVEEVELVECNPQYAHVRMSDGRECTVSLRQLAPTGAPVSTVEETGPIQLPTETEPSVEIVPSGSIPVTAPELPDQSPETLDDTRTKQIETAAELMQKQQRVRPYNLRNRVASVTDYGLLIYHED